MSEQPAPYYVMADYYGDPATIAQVAAPPGVPDIPNTWTGGHAISLLYQDGVTTIRCSSCGGPTRILTIEPIYSPPWCRAVKEFLRQHPTYGR